MALFMKQDFSPPILSKKWIAIKFRPNMLIYSHENIIAILESGLLFREDSVEVEQEAPCPEVAWRHAGGGAGGWLTRGERNSAIGAIVACLVVAPPRNLNKWTLIRVACLALAPLAVRGAHRARCRGSLRALLGAMREYMALARRATACCREYAAMHAQLVSVTSAIESTHAMLCRQQKELLLLMSRATSALLGNIPWLRGDIALECETDSLMKIHHAFLVVQSTLLKHIALAHYIPSQAQKLYKNHNERIYWIHHTLIDNLIIEFKENYESLERMYRLLKNYGTKDSDSALKRPGSAIKETWLYSDIHTGVARACLELKLALNKCNDLDMFLDSCALNKQAFDLNVLNKDIDAIIDGIANCLSTMQNSQIRLKKLQNKFKVDDPKIEESEEHVEDTAILKIEQVEPEIKDEVFYFVKTDDDDIAQPVADVVTAPGRKEKETTKMVLNELKRKLVKREDLMRERERQALAKTMPDSKNVPEFPRQISLQDFVDRKGFISKIERKQRKKIKSKKTKNAKNKYRLKVCKYIDETDITDDMYEANAKLNVKNRLITVGKDKNSFILNKWVKKIAIINNGLDSSGLSDGLSDVESDAVNLNVRNVNQNKNEAINYKFNKKDLDLTSSSSDSEFDIENNGLLKDVRRYRATRKKNFPAKRASIDKDVDESMKPIEYRFGTGMAMASVLQINNNSRMPNMAAEEVFIGNGEVSDDSGNDEDA
ncbi:uncharacterized protein LOC119839361 [Zerene cesonia]|uniref:uncharacterized protein LOC119839361 n=1 Tax=Zerene cesonia TaxID=33412 RepID=UPI0018E5A33D|nr:uncharacterized protein LOC119839361 [Zerene cesonia]